MPVGIGFERGGLARSGAPSDCRFASPPGFHPGAVWLAVATPLLAIGCLLVRLAS